MDVLMAVLACVKLELPAAAVLHGLQLLPRQILGVAAIDATDVDELGARLLGWAAVAPGGVQLPARTTSVIISPNHARER